MGALDKVERFDFDMSMFNWVQAVEQAFADFHAGYIDDDSLTLFKNNLPAVLASPGGSAWWDQRKAWFSHQFRGDVDELLANPAEESTAAGIFPTT